MGLKHVTVIVLLFALVGLLISNLRTERVFASGTIYITLDGDIVPTTANITTPDKMIYTFTGTVNDSIVVQRDNITIDGAGFLLNGTGSGTAISLSHRSNVTIMNLAIQNFQTGIYFDHCALCNITENTIMNNKWHAIELYDSLNSTIQGNSIINNTNRAIMSTYSSYSTIIGNEVSGNYKGIEIDDLSEYNTIQGNNIIDNDQSGVAIDYAKGNSIIENNITENHGSGIGVGQSSNTTVSSNRLINNTGIGIILSQSPNCTVTGNEVANNSFGISVRYQNSTMLRNNTMTNNTWNFELYFNSFTDFTNDVDTSNTINGKPIYYWIEKHDEIVPVDAGMVILFNCTDVALQNLHISDGIWQGAVIACSSNTTIANSYVNSYEYCVWLWNASDCQIDGNYLDGFISIQLDYSQNNIIHNNTFTSGGNWGSINIMLSSDNTFYHNNFTDNYDDVLITDESVNNWDNGYPDGGNYWDYYTTRLPHEHDIYSGPNQDEPGSDGFWDRPYPLNENNTDYYPIVPEYTPTLIIVMFVITTTLVTIALKRTRCITQRK